jgi:hypothetical protein
MMIEVSEHVLRQLPKEYVEAVVAEAMLVRNENQDRQATLVVVNVRRIAVILDGRANRGAVFPVEAVFNSLADRARQGLLNWLGSPQTRLHVVSVAGSWFDRKAVHVKTVEPSFVKTNMDDSGKRPGN